MPAVRVLVTGGTIDSSPEYDPTKKSVFSNEGTYVPKMLQQSKVTSDVFVEVLFLKDSADITDDDREALLQRCVAAPEQRLIITHGTDTMPETAHYLAKRALKKTVVLTGAMVPYSQNDSDALSNLAYALASAQHLASGVYVAMNGKIFLGDDVRKNKTLGIFENL